MPKAAKKAGPSSEPVSKSTASGKSSSKGPSKNKPKKKGDGGAHKNQKLSKKEQRELEKLQRQKAYIAPLKPQRVKPDPLDSTGLAYVLPPELVIVLRNLGKKAVKTKEKALDELTGGWMNRRGEGQEQVLIDMLPIWLSHLPHLLSHPSRRIRLAAATIHRLFVEIPAALEQMKLDTTESDTSDSDAADALGVWALAVHDIDPAVASAASESWQKFMHDSPTRTQITSIISFVPRAILDPNGLYAYLNPLPIPVPVHTPTPQFPSRGKQPLNQRGAKGKQPPSKGKPPLKPNVEKASAPESKPDSDESQSESLETDTDRDARIRCSGLGSLAWIISHTISPHDIPDELLNLLVEPKLWSSLSSNDPDSFGFEQPPVRKSAWRLVGAVGNALGSLKSATTASSSAKDGKLSDLAHVLSASVLLSAWTELDAGVQGIMWQPLLKFLKENPDAWKWEMEYTFLHPPVTKTRSRSPTSDHSHVNSDSEESGSDSELDQEDEGKVDSSTPLPDSSQRPASSAYQAFLLFLRKGCNGSPVQAYPAVVIVLSTLQSSILLSSYTSSISADSAPPSSAPFADLFDAFWAVLESPETSDPSQITAESRLFSGPGGDRASKAFVDAVLECVVFLLRRIVSPQALEKRTIETSALRVLVHTQLERVWTEAISFVDVDPKQKLRRLRIAPDVVGAAFGRVLRGLKSLAVGDGLRIYDDAWELVVGQIKGAASAAVAAPGSTSKDLSSLVSIVIKALLVDSTDVILVHKLLLDVFDVALNGCEQVLVTSGMESLGALALLTELLRTFSPDLERSSSPSASEKAALVSRIDELVVRNAFKLLMLHASSPNTESERQSHQGEEGHGLVVTYLLQREQGQGLLLWLALLEQVDDGMGSSASMSERSVLLGRLLTLLDLLAARRGGKQVILRLKPAFTELDEIVFGFALETISPSVTSPSSLAPATTPSLLCRLLARSHAAAAGEIFHPLLTGPGLVRLTSMLLSRFDDVTKGLLGIGVVDTEAIAEGLDVLERLLTIVQVIMETPVFYDWPLPILSSSTSSSSSSSEVSPISRILPNAFLLVNALPRVSFFSPDDETEVTASASARVESVTANAKQLWEKAFKVRSSKLDSVIARVYPNIVSHLRALLERTGPTSRCTASDVVEMFDSLRGVIKSLPTNGSLRLVQDPIEALLPAQVSLDALLDGLDGAPISKSLGVVDDLAGYASVFGSSSAAPRSEGDALTYTRYTLALLRILSDDLGLARRLLTDEGSNRWWLLRHLMVLSMYAEGVVMVPAAYKNSPLFSTSDSRTVQDGCRDIVQKVQRIVAYIFTSAEGAGSGEWRKEVCQALLKQKKNITTTTSSLSPSLPPFANFLLSIVHSAARSDSYRDCRIVREVLGRLFQSGIGGDVVIPEEEANLWIQYARSVSEPEKSAIAPLAGITILSTLVINLPSSSSSTLPRLDRYRNELASALLGVPPSRATSDGLRVLLKLVMGTAPDMEGEVEFLPVQRAVNVVKACQKWVEDGGGDDDEDEDEDEDESGEDGMEELESAMTLTFFHLAPILQSVPGSHWSFIFDVLENNIENCEVKFNSSRPNSSSASSSQLTTLARTLRLIGHIQDLASTNKSLRADWSEKRDDIMRGVQNMLMGGSGSEDSSSVGSWSIPEGVCRKLALELVAKYLPNKLVSHESLSKMCHLLSALPSSSLTSTNVSPIIEHHKLAYQILQKVAAKYTEHFVFEAGLDTEGVFEAKLPEELMVVLQRTLDFDLEEGTENRGHEQDVFVYLLGWMLLFDLFTATSMKVRMRYIEQIRNLGLIERHFIPNIFGLLGIDRGIVKTFKLDIWSVNEFYVQFYEAGSQCGIQTFAAHLYYRALLVVPSLIYAWVLDCRDRQLSSTIATYTSSHFSPVLIRTELDHVKSPEAQSELSSEDNQLTVKVASGAVNEVTASYLVDEQQLEIRLRIPGDWPLHRIEIRDTKKIGVDDNRWRSWILAVQQTIWAQNGRIVDGLALFKKNVTGHFAGQVECAICYSLISVMDSSLPTKPCNTCKNRFHAGCLFKWFSSSHSSSCPLCRSDILH